MITALHRLPALVGASQGLDDSIKVASQLHAAGSDLKGMDATESLSHLEPERGPPCAPGLGLPLQTSSTPSARSLMSWCTGRRLLSTCRALPARARDATKRRLLLRQTPSPAAAIRLAFASSNLRAQPLAADGNCALRSMEVQTSSSQAPHAYQLQLAERLFPSRSVEVPTLPPLPLPQASPASSTAPLSPVYRLLHSRTAASPWRAGACRQVASQCWQSAPGS